jgi:spore coat protein U-like protein
MRLSAISMLAGAAMIVGVTPALAATTTGTFDVNVLISASCAVAFPGATTLDFGNPADLSAFVDASLDFTVNCSGGTNYNVVLDNGLNSLGTRRMRNATTTQFINYDLYSDNGRTTQWPAIGIPGTGTGGPDPFVAAGRIPAQTTPASDANPYTDTITITVTW